MSDIIEVMDSDSIIENRPRFIAEAAEDVKSAEFCHGMLTVLVMRLPSPRRTRTPTATAWHRTLPTLRCKTASSADFVKSSYCEELQLEQV